MSTAPAVKPIPEGFHTLTPYLVVSDAAQLIAFLQQAFGATELFRVKTPQGGVMHAQVKIDDSMLEMADANQQFPPTPAAIHLYVRDADAVYRRAIAAGASSLQAPADQPYGDREAAIKDPAGNIWYIATHKAAGHAPQGFRAITPFLHLRGARPMIDFLKKAFAAEEVHIAEQEGAIVHATIRIGDSFLELAEAHGQWQPLPCTLHLYVTHTDALYNRALAAGATCLEAPVDKPYGDRSAGVLDSFGNRWFIATHIKDVAF